jgi:LPS export ABC transporter protein LptC
LYRVPRNPTRFFHHLSAQWPVSETQLNRFRLFPAITGILAFIPFFCIFFAGCTLEYLRDAENDDQIPEFIFTAARMSRVEDNILSLAFEAAQLEQYKDENSFYGIDIRFTSYDSAGIEKSSGAAGSLYGNQKTEEYMLLDGAVFVSRSDGAEILSESLRWNGKNEQLVSGSGEQVIIRRETSSGDGDSADGGSFLEMTGYGFAASGITLEYEFGHTISGMFVSGAVE